MKLVAAVIGVLLVLSCTAQVSGNATDDSKVDPTLAGLLQAYVAYYSKNPEGVQFEFSDKSVRVVGDMVLIDAVAVSDAPKLEAQLGGLGATNLSSYGLVVSCFFPIKNIDQLASLIDLRFAAASRAITREPR